MGLHKIINGCLAMEKDVASIYGIFMQLFPEEKYFWEDLYNDEKQHYSWLTDPHFIESIDLLPSKDMLPSMELIDSTLKIASHTIMRIKSNPITLEDALRISLRLEESMVEAFANELMANVLSTDYNSLSNKIISAERLHIDKIEDLMIKKGFLLLS